MIRFSQLSTQQVYDFIGEVAPRVEEIMEVPVDPDSLTVSRFSDRLDMVLFYDSQTQEIGVHKSLITPWTSADLKRAIGHELCHRAQFTPEFTTFFEGYQYFPEVHMLLEGDAVYVEKELEKFYPPSLTRKLEYTSIEKICDNWQEPEFGRFDPYVLGYRRVKDLKRFGERSMVNAFYDHCEIDLITAAFNHELLNLLRKPSDIGVLCMNLAERTGIVEGLKTSEVELSAYRAKQLENTLNRERQILEAIKSSPSVFRKKSLDDQ